MHTNTVYVNNIEIIILRWKYLVIYSRRLMERIKNLKINSDNFQHSFQKMLKHLLHFRQQGDLTLKFFHSLFWYQREWREKKKRREKNERVNKRVKARKSEREGETQLALIIAKDDMEFVSVKKVHFSARWSSLSFR